MREEVKVEEVRLNELVDICTQTGTLILREEQIIVIFKEGSHSIRLIMLKEAENNCQYHWNDSDCCE